ncbi:MAG TPA: DUF1707 domain-containing protein [Streptosporangiaceae bacterium]|nr:DUF1707 domain-containing protein [Streptosporangiaceae bacterium]
MPLNPDMRASDADRDRVAAALREHYAQGRLTADELEERLAGTYQARTVGDLQRVTADLPEHDLSELPVPAAQRSASVPVTRGRGDLYEKSIKGAWAAWASVSLVCAVIWLISVVGSASWIYPWPVWVAGPWAP